MALTSKLCVVVIAETLDELRRQRDAAAQADMVELRLDRLSRDGSVDVVGALADRRTPVIVTCRPTWEGGYFQGSEETRRHILRDALREGAEYVDVEWRAGFDEIVKGADQRRVVLSSHDFDGVPPDLTDRARAMRATGVGVVKLAATAHRLSDTVKVLESANALAAPGESVFIAMGPCGDVSRVCAARFGSAWTYAGSMAGLGQIGPRALVDQYRFRAVSASTPLFGIVGRPVSHSVSPAMHNAAFGATGLDGVYIALPAADIEDFEAFTRAFQPSGVSVTIPYKIVAAGLATRVDPLAKEVGAVNTLRRIDGRWEATNTDVAGFLQPLRDRDVPLQGARVAILGAGGSARAVAIASRAAGATVTIHARSAEKASGLAEELVQVSVGAWPVPRDSWDVLVNCTPVGMYPHVDASPLDSGAFEAHAGGTVYDLVYNPQQTCLLQAAARAGCQTIGGLEMLVAQAQDQFFFWTGVRPDATVMRAAALARLAEFSAHEDHHA